MEITHELLLDLQQIGTRQVMFAKQGDSLTRTAMIRLYDGGTEFSVPDGVVLQIAFAKSDGKGGLYDKMPDGSDACTSSGNVVTAKLHPQMFTVSGLVSCELRIVASDGTQISTFLWFITVQASAAAGIVSEDYFRFATLDGIRTDVGDISKLKTNTKKNLVAAINEVLGGIPKDYVKSVNNVRPLANGDLLLYASDIDTQLPSISYQGSVEGALKAILSMPALPIARGTSADGIAYTATDDASGTVLPTVSVADNANQIAAVGKGLQIVFIPTEKNLTNDPTLQLNDGEIIPIRLRAQKNQGSNDQSPDATIPVPVGALMTGVPYTMTFCGKYWLVDSQITQFTNYDAAALTKYANRLTGLSDSDTIAVPIINSIDGVSGDMATMFVMRSAEENRNPNEVGDVRVPTIGRVSELIRKDITADYTAWTPESGTVKTVENYAKTLQDGSYRIADDTIGRYEIEVFTVMNGEQWRILREHDDQFCYIIFYCGETISILIDTETCDVQVGGRKMLTDWNIPLPTAADVGKVLTASAVNRAAWTEVTNAEEVAV